MNQQQLMMEDLMSAQACSIDSFSKAEIADAYEILVLNQQEFLSDSAGGRYLRSEVMRHFKDSHPDCTTPEQMAMAADLEDDIDVKNACIIKINAEKYAENALKH